MILPPGKRKRDSTETGADNDVTPSDENADPNLPPADDMLSPTRESKRLNTSFSPAAEIPKLAAEKKPCTMCNSVRVWQKRTGSHDYQLWLITEERRSQKLINAAKLLRGRGGIHGAVYVNCTRSYFCGRNLVPPKLMAWNSLPMSSATSLTLFLSRDRS